MKEKILRLTSLTNEVGNKYSKDKPQFVRGGVIFMEGKGDMSSSSESKAQEPVKKIEQKTRPQDREKGQVPPEKIAEARRNAIKAYGDLEKLPFDQRQTVEELIKIGRSPMPGGSGEPEPSFEEQTTGSKMNQEVPGGGAGKPPEKPPTATGGEGAKGEHQDPRIQEIADEVKAIEVKGEVPSNELLEKMQKRLENILDSGTLTDIEGRKRANDLISEYQGKKIVPKETTSSFQATMLELAGAKEMEKFDSLQGAFLKIAKKPIVRYEDIEASHRDFGNAYSQEKSKIYKRIAEKRQQLQKEKNEKLVKEGKPTEPLTDQELDLALQEERKNMDTLDEVYRNFGDILAANFGTARRGVTAEQQTLINNIDGLEEKIKHLDPKTQPQEIKNLRGELRDQVLALTKPLQPENEPLPDEILRAIAKDEFATEEFFDRIIRLVEEDTPYHLPGFYSDINKSKFLKINENLLVKDKKERLLNMVKATETLHNMNQILKTSVDQFAQVSQGILSAHLTTIFKIPGVEEAYSLYEGVNKQDLGIETMITDNVAKQIDDQVEAEFAKRAGVKIKKAGKESYLIESLKGEGEQLEDWERTRGFIYARNLHRTLLRQGEYASLSRLPKGAGGEVFISQAQQQLLGVLHVFKYLFFRFKPQESTGGIELAKAAIERSVNERRRGRDGNKEASRGIVRLKTINGTDVDDTESTTIVGVRGFEFTWRAVHGRLKELDMIDNGKNSNIQQFFDDHAGEISILKEISENNAWEREFKRTSGMIDGTPFHTLDSWKKARIEKVFGQLIENNATALGVLVSPIPLTMPIEVKQILWERIAELNPDVMASILTRLEIDEKAEEKESLSEVKSLEEILLDNFGTPEQRSLLLTADGKWKLKAVQSEYNELDEKFSFLDGRLQNTKPGEKQDKLRAEKEETGAERDAKKIELAMLDSEVKKLLHNSEWQTLRYKLRTINTLRIQDEKERIMAIKALKVEGKTIGGITDPQELQKYTPKNFQDYLGDPRFSDEDKLTGKEKAAVNLIAQNGKLISQDLANIKRAYVWFLDDVPSSLSKWENLGQVFNRMIADFGQFAQSTQELGGFFTNPFQAGMDKTREHLAKAIASAGSVLGMESVQDNMSGIVTLYNKWNMAYPEYRQKIRSAIRSMRHKYNSKAQEVSRDTNAPALDESGTFEELKIQNTQHVTRREKKDKFGRIEYKDLFKKMEKELGVTIRNRFWKANARDYGPFFLIGILIEFFKETFMPPKQ